MKPYIRRLPLAGALVLTLTVALGGTPATAQPGEPAVSPPVPAATAGSSQHVTLITGDRVWFGQNPYGRYEVTVDPAPRDGFDGSYQLIEQGDQLYVLPEDAAALVPVRLDRELFNVTKLASYGYTDGVPVIATGGPANRAAGLADRDRLSSIGATAATVEPDGQWWRDLPAGSGRVWLDEQVQVSLAESVPLVGAPAAWSVGLDGTGTTVAVLDTGVDSDHPDLAGKVIAEQNFTDSAVADDRFGHGTHVAGIIAGSGAASGGTYTGVAPGARLLNGKVLGDNGSGEVSDIIAGMEWAAQQGADVINMSLGGPATDGTDPLSLAVNELTAEYGVLFAIAAGNSGGDRTVNSPGAADAALTVGSVDKAEQLAGTASRGPRLGDFAIKPDLTAPGVGIVSARAEGTALGPIVDDQYTRIGGTSMATPHVAAAAAILLQDDPSLTPEQLKARLIAAAVPNPGLDVYQQGGGRLDIPAALDAVVEAAPAPLNLGHFQFPHDDVEPVSEPVTYTNLTDQPLTLELELAVRSREGAVPSPAMLSVSPSTLTIEPGGTATATVTLDPAAGPDGLYGGYLVATDDAGSVAARTPLGFHKEPERYDITVIGIDRNGRAAGGISSFGVLNVDDMSQFLQPGHGFADGVGRVRVPPGKYSVLGLIHTYDAHGTDVQSTAFVGDPELTVTEDVTLVLDARDANRVTVATPDHPQAEPQAFVGLGYWRTAARPGPIFGTVFFGTHPGREYYAAPTDPISQGGFEMFTRWRLAEPEAELSVIEPVAAELDPLLSRAPAVDGPQEVRLVDVGAGTAEDYQGLDVAGAAVLARRGPSLIEQEQHAAAAGAVALIVSNDVPGRLVGELALAGPGTIPTLTLTQAEGEQLRALLAQGEVTVRLDGTRWSPYLYDLVFVEAGEVPDQLEYTVELDELARLDIAYHNDVPGHLMEEVRHFARPFHSSFAFLHPYIDGPRERTEYVFGGEEIGYRQTVWAEVPGQAMLEEPGHFFYEPGSRVSKSFYRQVLRPALLPQVAQTTRTGDVLDLNVFEWVDAGGNLFPDLFGLAPYPGDTVETRLYADGELIGEAERPLETFELLAEPASYRLELDVRREAEWWHRSTSTSTVWTFNSQRPAADTTEVLPLLSVDYLIDLDLQNRPIQPPGQPVLGLQVRQQVADQPAVAGARLWVSYDDGESWRSRPVRSLGGGRFEAVLPFRGPIGGSGYASVRVEAWDTAGNRIEQEVIRAWPLR
ncbi:MAG TPA: S8 family serine peptidase [Natronosporangium sp.]